MELLLSREADSWVNLSEQNTYFMAKKLTDTWDEAGLVPEETVKLFTANGIPFVAENTWPYNPYQEDCDYYHETYPGFYCSETEAQGGGYDNRQQDPYAASATGASIGESHQLYASVDRVRQALYRGYPVILSFNANSDFLAATYKGGVVSWVFKVPGCSSGVCGHAVLAIGYQDDEDIQGGGYIIIKNSWGENWGDGGYAYLTYEWLENSILDAQAVKSIK
jgi:C1A family cysteine protease